MDAVLCTWAPVLLTPTLYSVLCSLYYVPPVFCTLTLSSVIKLQNHVLGPCNMAFVLGNNSDKLFVILLNQNKKKSYHANDTLRTPT